MLQNNINNFYNELESASYSVFSTETSIINHHLKTIINYAYYHNDQQIFYSAPSKYIQNSSPILYFKENNTAISYDFEECQVKKITIISVGIIFEKNAYSYNEFHDSLVLRTFFDVFEVEINNFYVLFIQKDPLNSDPEDVMKTFLENNVTFIFGGYSYYALIDYITLLNEYNMVLFYINGKPEVDFCNDHVYILFYY